MIRKVLRILNEAEHDKEELNKQYEILHKKNAIRSAEVKKSMAQKSKELATRKSSRDKQFNIIRNK